MLVRFSGNRRPFRYGHGWLAALVIVPLAYASCGDGAATMKRDWAGTGVIVTLVGRGVGATEGDLVAFDQSDPGGRILARRVDVPGMVQYTAPEGSVLGYTTTDLQSTEVQTVNVRSGVTQVLGPGNYPVSSEDWVAFCDPPGRLLLAQMSGVGRRQSVDSVSPGCASMVWRGQRLAYLQLGTSEGLDGVTVGLWEDDVHEKFDVPASAHGYGPVTWSADGQALMYSTSGGELVEIDLNTRLGRTIGVGMSPKYSPVDPDLYAVVVGPSVEVRNRDGRVVASHPLLGATRFAADIAWSPEGNEIAIVSPECLDAWDWRLDTTSCVAKPQGAFLPVVLWFR